MDLRQIECFLSVAHHLHFRRAGEALNLSPATVSEAVRRLEVEIGADLFDRTTRQVTLTKLGESFHPEAKRAFQTVSATFERARAYATGNTGLLIVGHSMEGVGRLVRACAQVQRASPGLAVELSEAPSASQLRQLTAGQIHAAVIWGRPAGPSFARERIGSSDLRAILPPDETLVANRWLTTAELVRRPLLLCRRSLSLSAYDAVVGAFRSEDPQWMPAGEPVDLPNVVNRVLAGDGLGIALASGPARAAEFGVRSVPIIDGPRIEQFIVWQAAAAHRGLAELVGLLAAAISAQ